MDGRKEKVSDQNGDGSNRSRGQIARWALALLVAIAATVYYLRGVEAQFVCHGVLDRGEVVELCEPPGLSELVPFALVIVVLLAPDLTELAIPGLLSLKRTVRRQEGRQDRVEMKLAQVEQRVDQQVNFKIELNTAEKDVTIKEETLRAARSSDGKIEEEEEEPVTEPVARPDKEQMGEADEGMAEPEAKGDRQIAAEPPGLVSDEDDERASLTLQLSWLVKNLTQYETISRMRRVDSNERMGALTEAQQEMVDRWYTVFEQEIGLVKQFRNALIHNPYAVDMDELREAVRMGRRLMRILLSGIGAPTEALDAYGEPKANRVT